MKYLLWLLKAAIFFTLFAFALNNQQDATVHFFFGTQWRAPLVLVVLTAFSAGLIVGVLGMVPRWWKHRSAARQALKQAPPATPAKAAVPAEAVPAEMPPIHGI
ncbi:putative integral membrane protein [Acidovorax sp. CF316]|uniref:LapA family protein n=1 Tax=Acidovorax sp. CF316 TaxID=1144317 RepID=UPI00026BCB00|nr:LapA family protein [Acidovorax sp. CF316]EJE53444.1 putative integral membrane protein [Acidovorax sp. CF316]